MKIGDGNPVHSFNCCDCGAAANRAYMMRVDGELPKRCGACGWKQFRRKHPELGVAVLTKGEDGTWTRTDEEG
jgi:predicted RNA-binding Zn-ribbon protein involved in translation (DUF1610 family)